MSRSDVAAVVALTVAICAFFGPALFGDRAVFTWNMDLWQPWARSASPADLERPTRLADCARQFAVMRTLATEAMHEGRIPLWNRWIYSGTPFLANFQPGVFYPPNVILALAGLSVPAQMTVYLAFHLLVGVVGTYVLLRTFRVRPGAALLGAIVFGWSGYNASRTGIPTMVATGSWLPWALAASHRWFLREDGRSWAGMAGALAMSGLAGFAQIFVFVAYAWAGYGLVAGLSRRPARHTRRWLGWAAAGAVGLALVSVHLVPTLEFMRLAQDATNSSEMLASGTLHPWALAKLLAPDLLGHPVDGTNATHLLTVGNGYYHQTERSTALYVGILPILLAAIILLAPGDRRREAFASLGIAGGGLLFCLPTPLLRLAPHLPGLGFSRPDRATFLWCSGLALLAGLGADRLAGREGPDLRRPPNGLALLLGSGAALVTAAFAVAGPDLLPREVVSFLGEDAVRRAAILGLATAAVSTAILFLRAAGRIGGSGFLAAALVLVGADLGGYSSRMNLQQPEESIFRPARPGGSLDFLQRRAREEGPFRILSYEPQRAFPRGILPPSTAAVYGIEDALGFDSINLARYEQLMRALDPGIVVKRGNFRGARRADVFASPLADLLNVRYVLAESSADLEGLVRVHASDLVVHENPDCLPRAFLVDGVRVIGDPGSLLRAMAEPSFRPDLYAYSEVPIDAELSPPPESRPAEGPPGRAHVGLHRDERVEVDLEVERKALLVLTDAHYPGWKAFVDGEERPIYRVDHVFRGVIVRPGDRRAVFEYDPASFRLGAGLSLAALGILGAGSLALARTGSRTRTGKDAKESLRA